MEPRIVTALPDYFYSSNTPDIVIDKSDPNIIDPSFFAD
jgi:hypothetical protein